jgi:heat shock protein HslJ
MSRRSNTLALVLLTAALLLVLVACSCAGDPLDGTSWRLTEWTLSSLRPADFTITARFADGRLSGGSGVNTYSGPYRAGPGNAITIGSLASTEMAGPEPAMRAERAYMTLLGQAGAYKAVAGRLTLYDRAGNESLIFEAADR